MKEYLRDQLRTRPGGVTGRHVVREILQAKILASLQRAGAMIPLAFHGGTALRFLYATLQLQHHDRASLLSGKLHAVLQRTYTKGRDLYDLIWYLSDPEWPAPNLEMLNNALRQSGWPGPELEDSTWRRHVGDRLRELDWPRAVADLRPFVESDADLDLVTLENARRLVDA